MGTGIRVWGDSLETPVGSGEGMGNNAQRQLVGAVVFLGSIFSSDLEVIYRTA